MSIPTGVLTPSAKLQAPPAPVSATAILSETLPAAWKNGSTTAISIATALSQDAGKTLPWKTVRDVIGGAIAARFIELAPDSGTWPCDLAAAQSVKLVAAAPPKPDEGGKGGGKPVPANVRFAAGDFDPTGIQDLADAVPKLLEVKAKSNLTMKFHVRLELGDGSVPPSDAAVKDINSILKNMSDGFHVN